MTPTAKRAIRIPPPPPFKNHGNEVISVAALNRFQQAQAEEGGAYILTETAATQLLVDGRQGRRRALGRQGPRQGRRAAGQLRARHGHHRQGDRAGRGLLGPPHRRRDPRVRPRRGPRAPGLGARRQGGLEGPQAAGPPDPHDRPVAAEALAEVRPDRRHVDLPDEERRRARTSSRSASSSTSSTPTPPRRPTTCSSSSSCTRWSRRSSRAASASPGAPRRCRAAATGRCPS